MTSKRLILLLGGAFVLTLGTLMALQLAIRGASEKPVEKHAPAPHKSPEKPIAKTYEFPGGGRTLLPDRQLIALYGTPGSTVLGALGEQDLPGAVTRVKAIAAEYQGLAARPVYPAFEIIATIASASATANGDYSREIDAASLQPWIDEAERAGVYVILDLQPGRTDFLAQAKMYEKLLERPHVGLALDPEWRLAPDQVHMAQIGRVSIQEVNTVGNWLADLTKQHKLPQKAFVLHQFRSSMLQDRAQLDTSRGELAYVIHVDGQGTQPAKRDTWRVLQQSAPANVHWGWKNFTRKDHPMLTPPETMQVQPTPSLVTYQ